ncbi:aminoacetone oxidase family FAD-binding enzyme, partial [Pseudomonas aeruginosa]
NQKKQDIKMALDVFPTMNVDELSQHIRKLLKDEPDKYIKNSLHGLIEERYLLFILEQAEIDNETTSHHLSNQQLNTIVKLLKGFSFNVNGTLPIDK